MKCISTVRKKRTYRFLSFLIACFMLLSAAGYSTVYGAEKNSKEETVYVVTGPDGRVQETIVSDHIYNGSSSETINDISSLSDIENVKGDETFECGDNGKLIWKAKGNDIYYQGKTSEDIPVMMAVEYYIDGNRTDGKDLEGKSGQLKIRIKYSNSGEVDVDGKNVRVPFVAITGFLVNDDCLTDISVSSGKVIDDGEKQIVAGIAAPGLGESVGISEKISFLTDQVEITGTAKDLHLEDMMTIVTGNVFEDMDIDSMIGFDMDSEIDELDNAALKLSQSTSLLYDGIHMMNEKAPELTDGVAELDDGAMKLNLGMKSSLEGSAELSKKSLQFSKALSDNLNEMKKGTAGISQGSMKIYEGMKMLKSAVDGDGTAENPGLKNAAYSVDSGLQEMNSGIEQAKNTSMENVSKAEDRIKGLYETGAIDKDAYEEIMQYLETSLAAQQQINVPKQLEIAASGIYDGLVRISASLEGDGTSENPGLVAGTKSIYDGAALLEEGLKKAAGEKDSLTSSADKLASGIANISEGQKALGSGAGELAAGMEQLKASSVQLADGIGKLDSGAMALSSGMKQFYRQGIKKIIDIYNSEIKPAAGNIDAVVKAGQQYRNFSGISDYMDGSVRFIYKTKVSE